MAVENDLAFDPFQCSKCGKVFSAQNRRDRHEKRCDNLIFLENEFEAEKEPEAPTYLQLVEKASKRDPTNYAKYVGRKRITEPNNLIGVYYKIIRKGKHGPREK